MLAGGLSRSEQHYNPAGARSQATMLTLAAIALILPAAYRAVAGETSASALGAISVWMDVTGFTRCLWRQSDFFSRHSPLVICRL